MKKILSMLLSVSMALSTVVGLTPTSYAAQNVVLRGAMGWLESAVLYFDPADGSSKTNVYYKKITDSTYTKIDDQLVRQYDGFWRADIMGISKGTYDIMAVPVIGGSEDESRSATTDEPTAVLSHDRSGYAFANGNVPGAYKMDGTPKDGAEIVYVSADDTSGLNKVFTAGVENVYTNPIILRILGYIPTSAIPSEFKNSTGMLEMKAKKGSTPNITVEGVGRDAALNVGIAIKGANMSHVELRNFAILNFEDDGIGVEKCDAAYFWFHNLDMFYGARGSASDQKKGDGTMDIKTSQYITLSYNHYWDSGKCHLLANGTSDTADLITYHHNWYDHSDSRHPRIRSANAHIYNNYFVGIGKYAVGAAYRTKGVFAEGNVFERSNRPLTISMQGNDDGTFSSEDGGIIKAHNNFMDEKSRQRYSPYDAGKNPVEFDAYEVTNRSDPVPSDITAKKGGIAYNNFDTTGDTATTGAYFDSDWQLQNSQDDIVERVQKYAGRMQNGDLWYEFQPGDENLTDDKMPALENLLDSYNGTNGNLKDSPSASIVPAEARSLSGERTGENTATIKFTPLESGKYWYLMSSAETATVEEVKEGVSGNAIAGIEVTANITPPDTNGVRVFVVVQNTMTIDSRVYTIHVDKYVDPSIPEIEPDKATRASGDEGEFKASVSFIAKAGVAGTVHYIVKNSGDSAPTREELKASALTVPVTAAGGTIRFDAIIDNGDAKDIYIVQFDAIGNKFSEIIKIELAKFIKIGDITVINFSVSPYSEISLPTNPSEFPYTGIDGITITGKSGATSLPKFQDRIVAVDGYVFAKIYNNGGASSAIGDRLFKFTTHTPGKVEIYVDAGTNAGRKVSLWNASGDELDPIEGSTTLPATVSGRIVYDLPVAGTYSIGCTAGGVNFYQISIENLVTQGGGPIKPPGPSAPVLVSNGANRLSKTEGTITFTSSKKGTYFVLPYDGGTIPSEDEVDDSDITDSINAGETITLDCTITEAAQNYAVVILDDERTDEGEEIYSRIISISIPAYVPPLTPLLYQGSAIRTGNQIADVTFASGVGGGEYRYSYLVYTKDLSAPTSDTVITQGTVGDLKAGFNTIHLTNLTDGEKTLYVIGYIEDGDTTISSDVLSIDIENFLFNDKTGDSFTIGDLTYKVTNSDPRTVEVSNCSTMAFDVVVPPTVSYEGFDYPVTSIGKEAFLGCIALKTVELPDGITTIEESGFQNCISLTSIKLPDSITSIEDLAFHGCKSLKAVKLSKNLTAIGEYAFMYCENLLNIEIPYGITSIGDSLFSGCKNLSYVKLPTSLEEIGSDVFYECENLTSIDLPDSLKSIGNYSFAYCLGLTFIEIPDSVTSIWFNAFWGSVNLEAIVIPASVTSIGDTAFGNCPITIYGTAGSYAEIFANVYSIPFVDGVPDIKPVPRRVTFEDFIPNVITKPFVSITWYQHIPALVHISATEKEPSLGWIEVKKGSNVYYHIGNAHSMWAEGQWENYTARLLPNGASHATRRILKVADVKAGDTIEIAASLETNDTSRYIAYESGNISGDTSTFNAGGRQVKLGDFTEQGAITKFYLTATESGDHFFSFSAGSIALYEISVISSTFTVIPVTDISLTGNQSVTVGDSLKLEGTVTPTDATFKDIVWSIIDDGQTGATISGDVLTGSNTEGTVRVRATIPNGIDIGDDFTKDFVITINPSGGGTGPIVIEPITDITWDKDGSKVTAGNVVSLLGATVTPSNATNKLIMWSVVSGPAHISGNQLVTNGAGTVIVRATVTNGTDIGVNFTKDFTISSEEDINPPTGKQYVFEASVDLAAYSRGTYVPAGNYGTDGFFTIALTGDGILKVGNSSTHTLEISSKERSWIEFTLTNPGSVEVFAGSNNSINESTLELKKDSTVIAEKTGKATVTGTIPESFVYENLSAGTYRILTAGTARGVRIHQVIVTPGGDSPTFNPVTDIAWDKDGDTVTVGDAISLLGTTVTPADATNRTIAWSVDADSTALASISGNTLTANAAGTINITATIANGSSETQDYTKKFSITAEEVPVILTSIVVTGDIKLQYTEGDSLDLSAMKITLNYSDISKKEDLTLAQFLQETGAEIKFSDGTDVTDGQTLATTHHGKIIVLKLDDKETATDPLVVKADNSYTASVTVKKDDSLFNDFEKVLTITSSSGESKTLTFTSGVYAVDKVEGDSWTVRVDGVSTGKTISKANSDITLDYYTVEFDYDSTTAPDGTTVEMTAAYGADSINSGAVVLAGKKLTIMVSRIETYGHVEITYLWNDANNTTLNRLVFDSLAEKVDATCTVTFTPLISSPAAVQMLSADSSSDGRTVYLLWQPTADDGGSPVTHYMVQEGDNTPVSVQTTSYEATNLVTGREYTFTVWAVNSHGDGTKSTVKVTPTAVIYSVVLLDWDDSIFETYTVSSGMPIITEPSSPNRDGYDFDGWYRDQDLTQKWDFLNDLVDTNITLYAKYTFIPILADDITLDENQLDFFTDSSPIQLIAEISPENTTNTEVKWTVDNESVATVDENGLVTPIGVGTATITVTTVDGEKSATCTVNVKAREKVATPTANIANGKIVSGSSVVLSTTTKNATIRYTTDGTEPTVSSAAYTAPIIITSDTTINAKAFKNEMIDSDATTFTYTVVSQNASMLKVINAPAVPDSIVEIPVELKNNSGMAAFNLRIHFDKNLLEPVSISKNPILSGTFSSNLDQGGDLSQFNYITAFWSNTTNITEDGEIFIVKFKVKDDDATLGDIPISIEITESSDEKHANVNLESINGLIKVVPFVYGDTNTDGVADGKDAVRLMQYLAEWPIKFTDTQLEAADAYYDGVVNGKDIIRLSQYLAEWDIEIGKIN